MKKKLLIVGAGVAGLSVGWKGAQAGYQVEIIEKTSIGAGASSVAGGMLAPTAEVRFEEERLLALGERSLAEWPQFARELEDESGLSIDYRQHGTLVVAVDRDDLEYINHMYRYQRELGLDATLLDGDEARQMEPHLAGGIPGAVWCPKDHNVDPTLLLKALTIALKKNGGVVREGVEAIELTDESTSAPPQLRVRGADTELLSADAIVLAAGSWSRKIANLPPDAPHIRPVKGEMLTLANATLDKPTAPLFTRVIRGPDAYLIPRSNGNLMVGATSEEMGWNQQIRAGGVFELLRGAYELSPSIYDTPLLDIRYGFRPVSLDNDPVVRESSREGVFYSTGFGRNGILLTPWGAQEGLKTIKNYLG